MSERRTVYRGAGATVVSALLAAVFAWRALTAWTGASALAGPGWAAVDALIALAAVVRCFDRVALTPAGLTVFRIGFPTRLPPGQLHQLSVVRAGSSARLIAQETTGRSRLLASRRAGSDGERALQEFRAIGADLWAGRFGPLTSTATTSGETQGEPAPRRCVRAACPAFRQTVSDAQCRSCGDRTQRVAA